MNRLQGKVAVVTGASKGIGASIAKALAAEGAAVAVNYASSREGADRVVQAIQEKGGKAFAVQGNVDKAADVERVFAETEKELGPTNVLVNNAGVYAFSPIDGITEDEFHRMFNINVLGAMLATQAAVKHFGDNGGSVINIGSVVSTSLPPQSSIYTATKGALDAVTGVLANELGARKIRVNSVNPGYTLTEGNAYMQGTEVEQGMVGQTPLGRPGQPEEIAAAVVFLASDDARWITGELLRVGGGLR